MILSCERMKAAEEALFASGVEAGDLMEKAGRGCAEAIRQFGPHEAGDAVLFVGKGHNGGDALVAGRYLAEAGWRVRWRLAGDPSDLAPLTRRMLTLLERTVAIDSPPPARARKPRLVLVDGLLGIGAKGPLRDSIRPLADELNRMRRDESGFSFAIDIPSGVDGDSGEVHNGAIIADVTLTIEHTKPGLVADQALDHVGRLVHVRVPEIVAPDDEDENDRIVLTADRMASWFTPLPFSAHKGTAGRVGIIAGARGFTGAGMLSALGALHAGGGLVTVFAHEDAWPVLAGRAPAEVMVRPVKRWTEALEAGMDSIGIGPGLGRDHAGEILEVVREAKCPVVVDADALNVLADCQEAVKEAAGQRLLTPHPGEMSRILPRSSSMGSRLEIARACAGEFGHAVLFKGSRTIVAAPGAPAAFNTTGNPGMASGGMGDVLTGVCAALAARGLTFWQAGCLGSWLTGRAAEIAVWERRRFAPEGLTASLMAEHLPHAIRSLRLGEY